MKIKFCAYAKCEVFEGVMDRPSRRLKALPDYFYKVGNVWTAATVFSTIMLMNASHIEDFTQLSPAESGFLVFDTGVEAMKARLAQINTAQKTLDLQYYAISDDTTANLLIEAIFRASERGVKVRFLIDDIGIGKVYRSLSAMDMSQNISVRVFNPINALDQTFILRLLSFFINKRRATKRMHNKAIIADRAYAITGGRNLGDEYFDAHAEMSFRDIDVLSTGPIAEDIAKSFDEFWNSAHAYPIRKLYSRLTGKLYIPYLRRRLKKNWEAQLKENPDAAQDLSRYLSGKKLIHAKAEYISDKPAKMQESADDPVHGPMIAIADLVEDATNEFIMVTPYFVPREGGMAWLKEQRARGLSIEVLTNSLASTDVVAVHTGYSHHRIDILKNRIKLYELKRINGKRTKQRPFGKSAPSYASLHAKIFIVDRRHAIIGSLNFDPRSAHLNTESAVVVDSPELAAQLYKMYQEAISPKTSYKLMLESNGEREKLVWLSEEDGQTVRYITEPKAGPWRILQAFLISLLPVEDQL